MKSIFSQDTYSEIKQRIEQVNAHQTPKWGKMNAAQMMHHCQKPIEIALQKTTVKKPNIFMRLLIKSFKSTLYNDKPWKQNLPTAKEFIVNEQKDFDKEKNSLVLLIDELKAKGEQHNWPKHPIFGTFTSQQWGQMQYKHLDHHLKQFNS